MATKDTKATEQIAAEDEKIGARLFAEMTANQLKDSYTPNGLPDIDIEPFTEAVVQKLQKRAVQLD